MIELSAYGKPLNLKSPVVGRVWKNSDGEPIRRDECILLTNSCSDDWIGYRGVINTAKVEASYLTQNLPCVHSIPRLDHLHSGDVVVIQPRSGRVRTLFRPDSHHNYLFATERCNSFCLMCSQPPVDRDDSELVEINLETIRLMFPKPPSLVITGGEPTLLGHNLLRIMTEIRECLPETDVHMLTNGRRFGWPDFTEAFIDCRPPKLTLGIPVYSDSATQHDYVVQARGAFDQTIQGLHRLARCGQSVEIRVVVHALTVPRLTQLAEYIYRNLSFASHVAFMGLEVTGFAKPNLDRLWIDPYDYRVELASAVEHLAIRGMRVSIYNHPLCLLERNLWSFARKSISDWKNTYLECCDSCQVRRDCGGFFETGLSRVSSHVRAVVE